MSDCQFDFLFASYSSREDFHKIMSLIPDASKKVSDFIGILEQKVNEDQTIEDLKKYSSNSHFFKNLLLLYLWLINRDYKDYKEKDIEILYRFLDRVRIPDHVARHSKWGVVFLTNEKERQVEKFWEEEILRHIDNVSETVLTLSNRITFWLIYHIGLKQLFKGSEESKKKNSNTSKKSDGEISATMEKVLIRYIDMVEQYPELEQMFGITIEKDMHRIYREYFQEKI
jgi:hypothetical protein